MLVRVFELLVANSTPAKPFSVAGNGSLVADSIVADFVGSDYPGPSSVRRIAGEKKSSGEPTQKS
jgi:hypothetical protein